MNILQLSGDFYPVMSGGALTDWNFAKNASAMGHDVTVFTSREGDTLPTENHSGVTIHRPFKGAPPGKHPNSLIGFLYRVKFITLFVLYMAFVKNCGDFDVVYSTNYIMHPVAKLLSFKHNLPVVNFIGYTPSQNPSLRRYDVRILAERVVLNLFMGDIVLCRTPECVSLGTAGVDIQLVHGLLDEEEIRAASMASPNNYNVNENIQDMANMETIVFVGRLVHVKNASASIGILKSLPENYQLLIVGDGEERDELQSKIFDEGVEKRVQILGSLPHKTTLQIIATADLLILTSLTEAYPTVVFESLALGTPVVATPVGILPEIDHTNLHLTGIDRMASKIVSVANSTSAAKLDESTLDIYSMERFTDTVLQSMEKLV